MKKHETSWYSPSTFHYVYYSYGKKYSGNLPFGKGSGQ
jgi:hypothetical protein